MNLQWPDGLDANKFLSEYWQQKPLLIRSAFKDFDNPIDPNELAGLSCDEDANSRYIEHTGNNEWRLCAGPFSDDFFDGVSGNEWSLLISDVEKLLPDFKQYIEPFRFLPDWRIDDLMISYAPVGGSVGAHVDQYDVFLLQADGVREWQIENTPRQGVQNSVSSTIAILGDFIADETWQLNAGDILYLPPQYAHHGIAIDEPCMTWSIGFRAPSVDEMLPEIMNYLLDNPNATTRFTDPKRTVATSPGLISTQDLHSLRSMLSQALDKDDDTLSQYIGRYITEPKELQEESEQDLPSTTTQAVLDGLNANQNLLCNTQKRVAYSVIDNKAVLYANGIAYDCSEPLAQAISDEKVVNKDILTQISTEDLNLLALLCQHQILLFETDD